MSESIYDRLSKLPAEGRAHVFVELNLCQWPKVLSDLKPAGWDGMSTDEKIRVGKEAWILIHALTTEYERSRQWWRETIPQKTEAEHTAWWEKNFGPVPP